MLENESVLFMLNIICYSVALLISFSTYPGKTSAMLYEPLAFLSAAIRYLSGCVLRVAVLQVAGAGTFLILPREKV